MILYLQKMWCIRDCFDLKNNKIKLHNHLESTMMLENKAYFYISLSYDKTTEDSHNNT